MITLKTAPISTSAPRIADTGSFANIIRERKIMMAALPHLVSTSGIQTHICKRTLNSPNRLTLDKVIVYKSQMMSKPRASPSLHDKITLQKAYAIRRAVKIELRTLDLFASSVIFIFYFLN